MLLTVNFRKFSKSYPSGTVLKFSVSQEICTIFRTRLQIINQIVQEELKALATKDDLKSVEEVVSKIEPVGPTVPAVHFTAQANAHFTDDGKPIPMPVVISENNSGLVPATGKVHVKVAGVYFITASILKLGGQHTEIYLMKNDSQLCRAWSYSTQYGMVSCSATIDVDIGDQLYVKLQTGGIHYGPHTCTFTGFLVSI
mgnify:CR=1 FL=1